MDPAIGVVSAIALVVFIIIRWQKLWPKFQMVLMVIIGWGIGGMVGSWLDRLIGVSESLSNKWGAILLGAAFPAALAIASLTIFTIFIWKDQKVPTGPVTWLVLIASLLVMPSLGMLPAAWSSVETVLNGVA
ncbi:hypothetical protein [Glycomyces salinus]|uniref:hypothetical protein n=1 Tax=Glycomyces salinus TaxID=980294 RepID=UPI0018ED6138|nr:hypothetical protein [Glycomyces salinus]